MKKITIDKNAERRPTDFSWQAGIGNDHAYLLHRADVLSHVKLVHEELGIRTLRCHGVFDDDMLTYQRMSDYRSFRSVPGNKKIKETNFRQVGDIYDRLLDIGIRPFVEMSFMPSALASGKKLGLRYDPNITMPRSLEEWSEYIKSFIHFLLDRYGKEEVENWYFEVWNEPDLDCFFAGKQSDYFRLYEATVRAVKSVDRNLRVGGPSTSACKWLPEFLKYCEEHDVPCDFVTTHHYPGDAFGNFINTGNIKHMFRSSQDAVRNKKKLSETMTDMFCLPDDWKKWEKGVLAKMDHEALKKIGDRPLFITEWNSMAVFASPVHDEKYSAAFIVRSCLDLDNTLAGYMFWCCSDLFEEQFMLPRPFVGSFGIVSSDGIPKPNFWAFKMLSRLYPERLVTDRHEDIDFGIFTNGKDIQILLTAQSSDFYANNNHDVSFELDFEAEEVTVMKIDDDHCNPKRLWMEMGTPDNLTRQEVRMIKEATTLKEEDLPFGYENGKTIIDCSFRTNDVWLIGVKAHE